MTTRPRNALQVSGALLIHVSDLISGANGPAGGVRVGGGCVGSAVGNGVGSAGAAGVALASR
jgi:hypothetical protein